MSQCDENPFDDHHLYDDGANILWEHPGTAEDCPLPECREAVGPRA